ncbi:MAG: PAS domain-containing protein [Acidobacteriota bacterium]|nr:PAS domain-containing protein [Acidobacteriota bacterium]
MNFSADGAQVVSPASVDFLAGGGEMGALMRSFDWSQSPLGPPEFWPQSLKTSVSICLNSRFPIIIWWGPDLVVLYNDDYIPILGGKHPGRALGRPGREVWEEIWPVVGPLLERVLIQGEANWADDLQLFINRSGYSEECYFRFSYSPIRDETGGIGGIFTPVSETTRKVIAERRLVTLRELGEKASRARTTHEACSTAAEVIGANPYDVPFAFIYPIKPGQREPLFVESTVEGNSAAIPERFWLSPESMAYFGSADDRKELSVLPVPEEFQEFRAGPWQELSPALVLVPVFLPGQDTPAAFLLAGASSRKELDSDYRTFFQLVGRHIGTAIANAQAYEEERKRAEALAELDRAKTAFFSNVSHEFRTPLTLMLGPLEEMLAQSTGLSTEDKQRLSTTHRNSLRLLKLVNSLLDFSRAESGRANALYQETDLARFTAELTSVFRSAVENSGLRLEVDCEPLPSPVFVDREMWEKIVLNLLSNAFKFTFQGEITVRLKSEEQMAELSIADTGIGIPEHELPHIFERFHRVAGARGRTFEGTGIGLALVQELVRLHGGTASAESESGKGTRMIVRIPFGSAHLSKDQVGVRNWEPLHASRATAYLEGSLDWFSDGEKAHGHGDSFQPESSKQLPHVLIADDNGDMREYLTRILQEHYRITAVRDGGAAWQKVLDEAPDLILSDVMMPVMNGFELLREVRNHPESKTIPIILLSARAGEESRIEGLDAGADDYLVKPFAARELLARVDTHLKLARIRRDARDILEQNEERLRLAVSAGRLGLWEFDLANEHFTASDQFREHFGRSPGEPFTLEDLLQSIHPDDRERRQHAVDEATRGGSDYQIEYRCIWPDGSTHWIQMRGRPSKVEGGGPQRMIGISLDITELKRAELRDSFLVQLDDEIRLLSDANEITNTAAGCLGEYLHVSRCTYAEVAPDGKTVHVTGDYTDEVPSLVGLYTLEQFGQEFAHLMRRGRVYVVDNVETDSRTASAREAYRLAQIGAVICFPLMKNGRLVAGMAAHQSVARRWTQYDIELLKLVANRCWESIERARIARDLRESELRFRTMADNIPNLAWMAYPDGHLFWYNRRWYEYTGTTLEEMEGWGWRKVHHPDHVERVANHVQHSWDTGEVWEDTFPLRSKEGEYRWFLSRALPICDSEGNVLRWFGTNTDITNQLRTEEALRTSEESYRMLSETVPQLIWSCNATGRLEYLSSQWVTYTGLPEIQQRSELLLEVLHPEDREATLRVWQAAMENRGEFDVDFRIRRHDGVYRWFKTRALQVRDSNGQVVKWFGTCTDVDDQVRIELELRRANQDLEQFAYSASHDLQEPLRNVAIYSQMIQRRCAGVLDEKAQEYLGYVSEGSQRIGTLVEDLLAYTQAASLGENPAEISDTNHALETALANLAMAIEENRATVTHDDLPSLRVKSAHLQQLFQNLISNAIKYRKDDEAPSIRVSVQRDDGFWRFAVQDNGIGIDPQYQVRIFGIFKRLHGRDKYPGTGIGLAICQKIVERYGGRIWVESQLGAGATFRFTLPVLY